MKLPIPRDDKLNCGPWVYVKRGTENGERATEVKAYAGSRLELREWPEPFPDAKRQGFRVHWD